MRRGAGAGVTIRTVAGTNHFRAATTDPAHDADPIPVSKESTQLMIEWLEPVLGFER